MMDRKWIVGFCAAAALALAGSTVQAQVTYSHDDGTVEDGIGIGGTAPFDIIWLNLFPVQSGGEVITSIQASFGSPADARPYNGLPVTALLYEDTDGGSTTNAVLRASLNGVISNANSPSLMLVDFDIADTQVTGNFLVGILARNLPGSNGFVASFDTTVPTTPGVSFAGFTAGGAMNENDLSSIGANYGAIEVITGGAIVGNWVVRANAVPVPEPTSMALVGIGAVGLGWYRRRKSK